MSAPISLDDLFKQIRDRRASEDRKSPESDERPKHKDVLLTPPPVKRRKKNHPHTK